LPELATANWTWKKEIAMLSRNVRADQQPAVVHIPPANRPSLVDEILIRHEPRGLLGRYFLRAESQLKQRGLTMSFISPADLAAVNEQNKSSWGKLIAVLDHRINTIDPDDMVCVGIFDADGDLVACDAARRLDVADSVTADMESLHFFYGDKAEQKRATDEFTLTAPSARDIRGSVFYLGGLWVHPKERNKALPVIITRIVRYAALAQWDPSYEVGIATHAIVRPELIKNYAFQAMEEGFVYKMNGEVAWKGVFFYTDRPTNIRNLDDDVAGRNDSASVIHRPVSEAVNK
jgi:hypothetical protein